MSAPRCDTLFISPHLDDIALSCPGRVLDELGRGRRVLIATLFSDVGATATAEQREAYACRRDEERRAAACLGVDSWMAGLPDAPWRSRVYRSHLGIAFGFDPHDGVPVVETVERLLAATAASRVFAPLSIGNHIDHRLCQQAVAAVAGDRDVWYYEDRPYALVDEAITSAFLRLGWRVPPRAWWRRVRDLVPSFLAARYVRCDLRSRRERVLACVRWALSLAAWGSHGMAVESEVWRWDDTVARRAVEALSCYRSQLGGLYGDADDALEAMRRHSAALGHADGHAERFWRPRLTA